MVILLKRKINNHHFDDREREFCIQLQKVLNELNNIVMKEEGIIYKAMENIFNFFDFIFGYTTTDNE